MTIKRSKGDKKCPDSKFKILYVASPSKAEIVHNHACKRDESLCYLKVYNCIFMLSLQFIIAEKNIPFPVPLDFIILNPFAEIVR